MAGRSQGTDSGNSVSQGCLSLCNRCILLFCFKLHPSPPVRKRPPTTLRFLSSPFKTPARPDSQCKLQVPRRENSYCFSLDAASTPDPVNCGKGAVTLCKTPARDNHHETKRDYGLLAVSPWKSNSVRVSVSQREGRDSGRTDDPMSTVI